MDKGKIKQNSHWGPALKSFLEEEGMLEEADAYATEKIQAWKKFESVKVEELADKTVFYLYPEKWDAFIKALNVLTNQNKALTKLLSECPPWEK